MLSDTLASVLQRRGIHYGWIVAGTTFLVMLATAGAMGSAGVLIGPLEKEFGWTTEASPRRSPSGWCSSGCSARSRPPS